MRLVIGGRVARMSVAFTTGAEPWHCRLGGRILDDHRQPTSIKYLKCIVVYPHYRHVRCAIRRDVTYRVFVREKRRRRLTKREEEWVCGSDRRRQNPVAADY